MTHRIHALRGIAAPLVLLALACGCGGGSGDEASVDLEVLSWKETQDRIASQKGRVVVVDVWSTSCPPCLKELPALVELHRRRGGPRLSCITVSTDYAGLPDEPPESLRPKVLRVLRKVGATCENVLLSTPDEEFYETADIASIPVVYVYGAGGELVERFDNSSGAYGADGFNYDEDITPLVERLLAAGGG